jgi:hypothetical protein
VSQKSSLVSTQLWDPGVSILWVCNKLIGVPGIPARPRMGWNLPTCSSRQSRPASQARGGAISGTDLPNKQAPFILDFLTMTQSVCACVCVFSKHCFCLFCFFVLRQGLPLQSRLAPNLQSFCLCLPGAGITGLLPFPSLLCPSLPFPPLFPVVLGMEPKVSHMLSKPSTTDLHPEPL